jgi:UDP-N-acetylmuramyl pentapeptide synthase
MNKKNIYILPTAHEAQSLVQSLIKKGDVVLVKGSHAMQLERIVEEIRVQELPHP